MSPIDVEYQVEESTSPEGYAADREIAWRFVQTFTSILWSDRVEVSASDEDDPAFAEKAHRAYQQSLSGNKRPWSEVFAEVDRADE